MTDSLRAAHGAIAVDPLRMAQLGRVEPRSGTAEVGGSMILGALEAALATHALTLGPLSPRARTLTVAAFLQGPDAGLRAIPGGRLEPLCLALTAVFADGAVYRSHPSPRSAAGPDLCALLLGAEGRFAMITEGVVRCFPLPVSRSSRWFEFPNAAAFVSATRAALSDGAWLESIQVQPAPPRIQVEFCVFGSCDGLERDLATLLRRAAAVGARAATRHSGEGRTPKGEEREATWDAVVEAAHAQHPLELHRVSLASVVVRGDANGLSLQRGGAWPNASSALGAAMAARGVLGGAE